MINKFPGFPKEPVTNYWPYPKALNGWWHILNGSEQKVLDYILRHTWGFKKTADKISISQFCNGVPNCDKGTGLSKNSVIKALKSLEEKGFIRSTKESDDKQHFTTLYELIHLENMEQDEIEGVVQDLNYPSANNEQGGSSRNEQTIKDKTIKDLSIDNTSNKQVVAVSERGAVITGYSKVEDLTETDLQEIAERYQVPLPFVRSKYDDMMLWVGEKPNDKRVKGRNWRMTLMNWVKRDALKIRKEASEHVSKRGIDARGVK